MDRRKYFEEVFKDNPEAPFHHRLATRVAGRAVPALVDAFALPGDVMTGKVPMYDEGGHVSPEVIERSFDTAGTVALGTGVATKGIEGPVLGSGPGKMSLEEIEAELTNLLNNEFSVPKAPVSLATNPIDHINNRVEWFEENHGIGSGLNNIWQYVDTLPKHIQEKVEKQLVDKYHEHAYKPQVKNADDPLDLDDFEDSKFISDEQLDDFIGEWEPEPIGVVKAEAKEGLKMSSKSLHHAERIKEAQKVPMKPVSPLAYDPPDVRLDRAQEMGFDIDEPWYHGTGSVFDEFDPKKSGEKAAFFANDPRIADNYSGSGSGIKQIIPAYIRKDKIGHARWSDYSPHQESYNGYAMDKLLKEFRNKGFDGVRIRDMYDLGGMQDQMAIFNPSVIRSKFAAFDPSLKDSAKYMSGLGAAGILSREFGREEER